MLAERRTHVNCIGCHEDGSLIHHVACTLFNWNLTQWLLDRKITPTPVRNVRKAHLQVKISIRVGTTGQFYSSTVLKIVFLETCGKSTKISIIVHNFVLLGSSWKYETMAMVPQDGKCFSASTWHVCFDIILIF